MRRPGIGGEVSSCVDLPMRERTMPHLAPFF
jgi:hypothetical protein